MKQSIILMAISVHYELLSDISHGGRDSQTGRQVAGFVGGSICVVRHRRRLGDVVLCVCPQETYSCHSDVGEEV